MAYQAPYGSGFIPPPPPGWHQPAYQQPAYSQPAPHQPAPPAQTPNGPPFKKQKGNPVITKYPPPPPGWKAPYQAAGYQPPVATYPPSQYAVPATTSYQGPSPDQSAVPTYQPAPYAQPSYPVDPSQAYQQPPYQPELNQAYQQPAYHPDQHQSYYQAQYQPPYQPAPAYSAPTATQPTQEYPGYYDANGAWLESQPPYVAPTSASSHPTGLGVTGMPDDEYTRHSSVENSIMEFDFDGEGTSLTDEIDPRFSLGLIIWHPAEERKRPLPSTVDEVELEEVALAKPSDVEHESVSKYFVGSKTHEIELSVRQTDEWVAVKDDLIFVDFVDTCEIVPLRTVIENRNRPDPSHRQSETVEEEVSQNSSHSQQREDGEADQTFSAIIPPRSTRDEDSDGDQAMDMSEASEDEDVPKVTEKAPRPASALSMAQEFRPGAKSYTPIAHSNQFIKQNHVLESLERALSPHEYPNLARPSSKPPRSARHSRSRSPEKMNRSRKGSQQPKMKPTPHARDATQENILAALGVEGSPKTVYPTPPPALAPPSPDRSRSPDKFHHPPSLTYHQPPHLYGPNFPPPPPPREARSPSFDPWKAHEAVHGNSRRTRSPSANSQRTVAGSDFYAEDFEDMDATPKAKPPPPPPPPSSHRQSGPDSGRKRTYDRMSEYEGDKRRRQADDTPKARRKPNYDRTDAYSRRW